MEITKVFLIPHFHFDFEWWKEEPHHQEDALIIIRKGLDLLREFPRFTFVIDTVLPLKYFLERNPGSTDEVKRYIGQGRLELVGGGLVSPDEGLPIGEGLVRQFYEGKEWYKETFGLDIRVGWEIDEFSHPTQIPQIMAMLGFSHFVFCRGVHPYDAMHPTLFRWVSPVAERSLTAYWWAAHYTCAEPTGKSTEKNLKRFFKEMRVRIPFEGARSPVPYLMIPLGGDFSIPTTDWIEFVDRWNEKESPPLEFSTPTQFFKLVQRETIPEVGGEFAPIYSGYFSSRERLKKRGRELENRLCSAEKLLSLCHVLGAPYPHEQMKRAWWEVLKSDFHDTICGTGTDRVFRKSLARYDRAESIIDACLKENDTFLSDRLSGNSHYVMNPCNWPRREIVEIDGSMRIITAPPLSIRRVDPEPTAPSGLAVGPNWVENRHIRVTVDKKTGAVGIYDRERDREVFALGGGRIVVEDDIGNLWASKPTGRTHPLKVDEIISKGEGEHSGEIAVTVSNRIAEITKRVIVLSDRKEVRFIVDVDFFGKDKRIVDTFPFSFGGEWLGEEPFGTSKKDDGTWPLQNGALYEGGDYRVAVINKGIPGHEFCGNTLGLVLLRSISMMSLAWVQWLIKNIIPISPLLIKALKLYTGGFNTYEFPLYPIHHVALRDFASEGSVGAFGALDPRTHLRAKMKFFKETQAWERGRHRFEYAILPDVADVSEMTRRGYELNNPLIVRSLVCTGKDREVGIVKDGTDSVIVTAIHPYRDGLIFRCYETGGRPAKARFSLKIPVKEVHLIQTVGGKFTRVPYSRGTFTHDFSAHEIASFYLVSE
jgi:alpha-mannosidase